MDTLLKDDDLFYYLQSKKIYLVSSSLLKINIFQEEDCLFIELHFKINPSGKLLKIKFIDIIEYSFYYKNNFYFYNVAYCKFFKKGNTVYISLDPFDEEETIHKNDQDFILCKNVVGEYVI